MKGRACMKLNEKECAKEILGLVGGTENVQSVTHCMTRLRFLLKDEEKINMDAIKQVKGVLGCVIAGGQTQVILGKNLFPVYKEIQSLGGFDETVGNSPVEQEPDKKEPVTAKKAGLSVLNYISASMTPIVPGLIAGGMLKVLLLFITMANKEFSASQTYTLLSGLANAPFYFMPILVAYGASLKLGGTPVYAMLCSATLLCPEFLGLAGAGEAIHIFGLPVKAVSYSSSLVPALLITLAATYTEKAFDKIVPGIFKSIFVGMGTVIVTMTLGFTILGPIGNYIGSYLATLFIWLGSTAAPVAVGLLAACLPWMVLCGMHGTIASFMPQAIANPGYDPIIRPAFLLHNVAEGGACIGVALRSKDAAYRSETLAIAFGCIMAGVTEPAIYGVNLKLKKPMYGVMAGGAAGGIVAGYLGTKAYMMGYSTVMALPIFQDTIIAMTASIIVCLVVSILVTYVLGYDENSLS